MTNINKTINNVNVDKIEVNLNINLNGIPSKNLFRGMIDSLIDERIKELEKLGRGRK